MKMRYGIIDEFITGNFVNIAEEMEELYGKLKYNGAKPQFGFNIPDVWALRQDLEDGYIEDTKNNQEIIDRLDSLDTKLYDEGRSISQKIINAKQKIPIYLDQTAQEFITDCLHDIEKEEDLKLDDLEFEELVKLYFKHYGDIDFSYVMNPYLILEKDIESDDDCTNAHLDKEYYEVICM